MHTILMLADLYGSTHDWHAKPQGAVDWVMKTFTQLAPAVWYVANLDQMIPRFTKDKMPAPVAPR